MDGIRLTPEDMYAPPVRKRGRGTGGTGQVCDGHTLVLEEEDGHLRFDVAHPEHCLAHGEGELAHGKGWYGGGVGQYYSEELPGIILVDYVECPWQYILEWIPVCNSHSDWLGEWYDAHHENVKTLEEAFPLNEQVKVWWEYTWACDSYSGEWDYEFYFWVPK